MLRRVKDQKGSALRARLPRAVRPPAPTRAHAAWGAGVRPAGRSFAIMRNQLTAYQDAYAFCCRHALLCCRLAEPGSTPAVEADAATGKRPPLLVVDWVRWALPACTVRRKEPSKGRRTLEILDSRREGSVLHLKGRSEEDASAWLAGARAGASAAAGVRRSGSPLWRGAARRGDSHGRRAQRDASRVARACCTMLTIVLFVSRPRAPP